jgi:hypothetical protein
LLITTPDKMTSLRNQIRLIETHSGRPNDWMSGKQEQPYSLIHIGNMSILPRFSAEKRFQVDIAISDITVSIHPSIHSRSGINLSHEHIAFAMIDDLFDLITKVQERGVAQRTSSSASR